MAHVNNTIRLGKGQQKRWSENNGHGRRRAVQAACLGSMKAGRLRWNSHVLHGSATSRQPASNTEQRSTAGNCAVVLKSACLGVRSGKWRGRETDEGCLPSAPRAAAALPAPLAITRLQPVQGSLLSCLPISGSR